MCTNVLRKGLKITDQIVVITVRLKTCLIALPQVITALTYKILTIHGQPLIKAK